MIPKNLEEIQESDIQYFVDNNIIENKTLEYKEIVNLNTVEEKNEFLADVSSFSNSSGGDLIIGIQQNKQEGTFIIKGIELNNNEIDNLILKMENIIRDSLEPRLSPIPNIRPIQLSNSKYIIIIRIRRSWNSPHRIKTNKQFFSRHSSGKYQLDIGEIKNAFLLNETLYDKIRRFREERIAFIFSDENEFQMNSFGKILLHIIPLSSFELNDNNNDINLFKQNEIRPLSGFGFGINSKINFNGYMTYSAPKKNDLNIYFCSYIQFFQKGIIEIFDEGILFPFNNGKLIYKSIELEKSILDIIKSIIELFKNKNILFPFLLFMNLFKIKGYILPYGNNIDYSEPLSLNYLSLGEMFIEDYSFDVSKKLKIWFDKIWNAFGYPQSNNFNQEGNWINR